MSAHEDKLIGTLRQVQLNQQEHQGFAFDLDSWADEMKNKEEQMLKKKSGESEALPPVRNSLDKKKLKKKKKKKPEGEKKVKRISGFDFRAWDKFDIDKALEEVDEQKKSSSSEYETDEEWEVERKKHLANEEKNKGNSHLSAGAFEVAVECYTRGMELDPTNALLPANRALALIKMEKYGAAEVDCTTAITLDPLYVKAYLRRAAARAGLQRVAAALEDYQRVLQLEPTNKQAKAEVDRLKKDVAREMENSRPPATSLETTDTSSAEVKAIYKPVEHRSKKPLRRIQIEEIGLKDGSERKAAIAKVEAQQSQAKKDAEAKDRQMFEKFTAKSSPADITSAKHVMPDTEENSSKTKTVADAEMNGEGEPAVLVKSTSVDASPASVSKPNISEIGDSGAHTVTTQAQKRTEKTEKSEFNKSSGGSSTAAKPSSPREGGVLTGAASVLDREAPQTSFQFQSDFKVLKDNLSSFYLYFKRIDPGMYPKLFGQSLEAPVLLKIVDALRQFCIPSGEDCFEQLRGLSEVKRFSMITMFMSAKEKQGLREVFQYLKGKGDHPAADLEKLMKKYEV